MLFNISELPIKIKKFKTLTADKIKIVSKPVSNFKSEELKLVCWRMVKACKEEGGVGYAAPQLGVFSRMFIISENSNQFRLYVNPKFSVPEDAQEVSDIEGCLSVPGQWLLVKRWNKINAEWINIETGEPVKETLVDYKARVFQHEHSHLNAKSILDEQIGKKQG